MPQILGKQVGLQSLKSQETGRVTIPQINANLYYVPRIIILKNQIKGYGERNMVRLQHVDKGKLNKCILKASMDTTNHLRVYQWALRLYHPEALLQSLRLPVTNDILKTITILHLFKKKKILIKDTLPYMLYWKYVHVYRCMKKQIHDTIGLNVMLEI